MRKIISVVALCAVIALLALVWRSHRANPGQAKAVSSDDAPLTVSAATVQPSEWQSRIKAYGQVRAEQGADLSLEIAGIVDSIGFKSGEDVTAGTVLLRLRSDDDPAKLAALQANEALWATNVARDRKQFDAQAISRATLDLDEANLRNFRAQVAAQRAVMEEKVLRAPFSGRIGIRQVDRGQYLIPGTPVVNLQALDPIYIDFNVSQQQLGPIKPGQSVDVSIDSYPNQVFHAKVQASDSHVDIGNRMASVRASLGNSDHKLIPGMFAVVRLAMDAPRQVLTVPLTAISFNPYGDYVYVLGAASSGGDARVANMRVVKLGEREGEQVVVLDGLKTGETVVTAGQIKLRSGSTVQVNNQIQPASERHPHAVDE
ncbi:MAG: efflux RND transporter periplasmic adaptor subunit [Dyella sp.]